MVFMVEFVILQVCDEPGRSIAKQRRRSWMIEGPICADCERVLLAVLRWLDTEQFQKLVFAGINFLKVSAILLLLLLHFQNVIIVFLFACLANFLLLELLLKEFFVSQPEGYVHQLQLWSALRIRVSVLTTLQWFLCSWKCYLSFLGGLRWLAAGQPIDLFAFSNILQFSDNLIELSSCLLSDVGLAQLIHEKHSNIAVVFYRADEQYLV